MRSVLQTAVAFIELWKVSLTDILLVLVEGVYPRVLHGSVKLPTPEKRALTRDGDALSLNFTL